jgi:hypothetical protein
VRGEHLGIEPPFLFTRLLRRTTAIELSQRSQMRPIGENEFFAVESLQVFRPHTSGETTMPRRAFLPLHSVLAACSIALTSNAAFGGDPVVVSSKISHGGSSSWTSSNSVSYPTPFSR